MEFFLNLFLFFSLLGTFSCQEEKPLVCQATGTCYQGGWNSTSNGIKYAAFQGIRFAQAPLGNLRFMPPQPLDNESIGTIDVSQESKVLCNQIKDYYLLIGQEDCLLLNIYIPEKIFNDESGKRYPVMVWIYGGGFTNGDNTFFKYGPQPYMDKDIILVTVNYRLGPFGFLSLGSEGAQGNNGLLDQNLALQWVQQNIGNFRGDQDMVTIFGESAGSLSVALQIVSPMSRGLFQRAILQSGVVLAPTWHFIPQIEATLYGANMAINLNCSLMEALECLQSKTVEEIYQAGFSGSKWMPTIDPSFMPETPLDILEKGDFDHNIEVIMGSNADEGLLFVSSQTDFDDWRNNFELTGPLWLYYLHDFEITEENIINAKKTVEYYIGSIDNYNFEHIEGIIDMYTDGFCLYGYYRFADLLMKQGVVVYQYILTYVGNLSFSEGTGVVGVNHADDLLYLWNFLDYPIDGDDIAVQQIMTQAWTDFATFGDPTPPGSEFSWTPLENVSYNSFWNISGPNPVMEHNEGIQERLETWKNILENP